MMSFDEEKWFSAGGIYAVCACAVPKKSPL